MSVLSTIQAVREGPALGPDEEVLSDIQECSRLVFTLASEAMYEHLENSVYFRVSLGLLRLDMIFMMGAGSRGL